MIWRILGLIGAGSFFVNGFSLLSDPSCVSADFGGGRVIQVTCRGDSSGTFSGTEAGLISFFIGVGLLTLIFFNRIKQLFRKQSLSIFSKQSLPMAPKNVSTTIPDDLVEVRFCNYCEVPVSLDLHKCPSCEGTYFYYKKVAKSSLDLVSKSEEEIPNALLKKCPMCAEEIKFEAVKCRFCQHSFVEAGVQKFNSSTSGFLNKALSKQFLPLTVVLLIAGLLGLVFGANSRSDSIEINQLLVSGEVCVGPLDGKEVYGCADYPNYDFSFCTAQPFSNLSFVDGNSTNLGGYEKPGSYSPTVNCSYDYSYWYDYTGEIDKLSGEYEMYLWGSNKRDWEAEDLIDLGSLVMSIRLKQ